MKQSYLFDFQGDKNFNLGKNVFFIMLPVISVISVIKIITIITIITPKNVILLLYFYLRALKKVLTPWKKKLTPWKNNLRAWSRHFQGS